MKYLPPQRTKLSPAEAAISLRDGWEATLGARPKEQTLLLIVAKSGLETGEWQSMWNFNFGNVKALGQYNGSYTCIPLNEQLIRNGEKKLVWFAPEGELTGKGGTVVGERFTIPTEPTFGQFGHPQTRMRAYETAIEGGSRYVSALKANFPKSFEAAANGGTAEDFVKTLQAEKYFTAGLAAYVMGTKRRCDWYASAVKKVLA